MPGLPLDVGVALAYKNEHRDAFSSHGTQHLERDLDLGDASDSRSETRFGNG